MPDLSLEKKYSNYTIAGVDEVGRGAWAGPVIAGAVILKDNKVIEGINDSKKIAPKKRQLLSEAIWNTYHCAVGLASVTEINDLGINKATFLAIERAIALLPKRADIALIDGNYKHKFTIPSINVLKGDKKSISIASASIIAKTHRDRIMADFAKDFPKYGWESNAGYGTKLHSDALLEHGCSKYHRIKYKPIESIIMRKYEDS